MSAEDWLNGLVMLLVWMAALGAVERLDFFLGRILYGPGRKGGR